MKKINTYGYFVLVTITVLALSSCHSEDPAANVAVNPKYEMNPPIADSVYVQRLQNDNEHVLLIAKFPKEKLEEKYLAINNGDEKIVLRDDGKKGDLKENDRLYSAKIKITPEEVDNFLKQQEQAIVDSKDGIITFVGRGATISKPSISIEDLNRKDFNLFQPILIPQVFPPFPVELKGASLMIIDTLVVEDPARTWNFCTQTGTRNGAWTFEYLMRNLATTDPAHPANDSTVSAFVLNWLSTYTTPININGDIVDLRVLMNQNIIAPWLNLSVQTPGKPPFLDMSHAPFKLLAIVNRIDLRGNSGYGLTNGGEGRFVFGLMLRNQDGICAREGEMTIIFEYGINKRGFSNIQAYAQEWYNLKDKVFGSPDYNAALQHITDQFALCGSNTNKTNQSSLNQFRTNETELGSPWEQREFHLDGITHQLKQVTVTNEPAAKYNVKTDNTYTRLLADYVNTNETAILENRNNVPEIYKDSNLLGGKGLILDFPFGPVAINHPHHWDGGPSGTPSFINSDNARQQFSLNTCSGCHAGETQTLFTHIRPTTFGQEAVLSPFLTGRKLTDGGPLGNVDEDGDDNNGMFRAPDPAGRNSDARLRQFNDLERRAIDLNGLVSCSNFCQVVTNLTSKPLLMAD